MERPAVTMGALWRLVWQLACAVLLMAAAAGAQGTTGGVFETNRTLEDWKLDIKLQRDNPSRQNLSSLVAITQKAAQQARFEVRGNLAYTNASTVADLTSEDIAFISCSRLDYPNQNTDEAVVSVLRETLDYHNITAVILYSRTADYCAMDPSPIIADSELPIYSMTDMAESASLLDDVNDGRLSTKYFVVIRTASLAANKGDGDGGDGNGPAGQGDVSQTKSSWDNGRGPSPSTAVAMIVLYSITGIITALFLVIIITGAVRAHRHPDRYGPRNILGAPRQSRARGLGRAILDTIPIVKFGEREQNPCKPGEDVEMGSTAERETTTRGPGAETQTARDDGTNARNGDANATRQPGEQSPESGIAPAEPTATGVLGPRPSEPQEEEALSCSICTEDFEKGQDIRLLPCDHKFHPECVDPWLMNVSGTCPLCRVDLRPTSSSSTSSHPSTHDPAAEIPPPLQQQQSDTDPSNNRRSALRGILSFRSRPNASTEERILALRRFREARNEAQRNGTAAPGAGTSTEDVAGTARRSRRFSARLSGVFGARAYGAHARRLAGMQGSGDAGVGDGGEGAMGRSSGTGTATGMETMTGALAAGSVDAAPARGQAQVQIPGPTEGRPGAENAPASDGRPASPSRPAGAQ